MSLDSPRPRARPRQRRHVRIERRGPAIRVATAVGALEEVLLDVRHVEHAHGGLVPVHVVRHLPEPRRAAEIAGAR
jgi:hypothetical protein